MNMFDIKLIRDNPDIVRADLEKRKYDNKILDEIIEKDRQWRQVKFDLQKLVQRKNEISKEINKKKKSGEKIDNELKELKELPKKVEIFQEETKQLKEEIDVMLKRMPNLMHESVPYGKDDSENVEIRKWGKKVEKKLIAHGELLEKLDCADFKRATKISGKGFYFLKNQIALLNQALIRFAIDHLMKKGYNYIEPPYMIRKFVYEGVTDYESFKEMSYQSDEDLFLIGTAEHPLIGMWSDEVLEEEVKLVGNSMCFRKEIGSHGVDEKGLFRVHQFNKVEQIVICDPEKSWEIMEELIKNAEEIFQALELPYRIVNICTGDLGIVASKKYDLEVWMPRQKKYREACSISNCTDYQTRGLNIKYGKQGGKKELAHSLNGTAIATSRALVAILENYQNPDGSVNVPKALRLYMNGITKIK